MSALVVAALGWLFFAPRRGRVAELDGGVQRVQVTVHGGYSPDVIRVRRGVPVELVFNRRESGDCTSRVVFADFAVSAALPAFERTTVRLRPERAGTFGFACGMNMVHGTLVVEPAEDAPPAEPGGEVEGAGDVAVAPASGTSTAPGDGGTSAAEVEAAQAKEHRAERHREVQATWWRQWPSAGHRPGPAGPGPSTNRGA